MFPAMKPLFRILLLQIHCHPTRIHSLVLIAGWGLTRMISWLMYPCGPDDGGEAPRQMKPGVVKPVPVELQPAEHMAEHINPLVRSTERLQKR